MVAILNFLSTLKSQHWLTTLIGAYVPSFTPVPCSVLEKTLLKYWPIRNFKVLWRQCLWRINTKETTLVRELIGNITASLVSCSVFLKKKFEVWKVNKQTNDRHQVMAKAHTGHLPGELKTPLTNVLCQIISNFIRVRMLIFTRFGGQNIYFLCIVVGSLSKYTHFFLFIFWWHQLFSFPFCFSLLVFPTLHWHIYIICSRENHHEQKYF